MNENATTQREAARDGETARERGSATLLADAEEIWAATARAVRILEGPPGVTMRRYSAHGTLHETLPALRRHLARLARRYGVRLGDGRGRWR